MKKTLFLFLCCTAALFGCRKETHTPTSLRPVTATQVIPSNPTLSGILGSGGVVDTIHLTSGTWYLSGLVYIQAGDVLIIDPGTVIKGLSSANAAVAGGGLIITRGAKILAEGTANNPIVFTSNYSNPLPGDWAGIVILGRASTNNAGEKTVEGVYPYVSDVKYGGTTNIDDNDNSGILKYVRIEYAGYEASTDNEMNGLTLAGVGRGTTIDYVEVIKARDDAFEWFGGTVNCSHLIAIDATDDLFDTDEGYRGSITYALGIADTTRADRSASNGIESDNNYSGTSATPYTSPVFNYVTIIGVSNVWTSLKTTAAPSGVGRYGRAAHLRRNTRFSISNSVFMGYYYGLSRDLQLGTAQGTFTNDYVESFNHPYLTEVNGGSITSVGIPAGNDGSYVSNFTNSYLNFIDPFDRSDISNFLSSVFSPSDGTAGAFPDGTTTWAEGAWVKLHL